jgi:hypothetical protein
MTMRDADTKMAEVRAARLIKVGAVVATSGAAALLGNSFVKAIRLAKEDLKNTTHRYELVIEEIQSPDQAVPAIEKLIKIDNVDALIVGLSISGQIVKPYATAAKTSLFCTCSVSGVGDELYTFTTMSLAEDEAARWVTEAKKRRIRRIARLTQDYPSIDNHVRALKAVAAPAGIAFVYEDRFEASTEDFRSRMAAAKATSPDVYFVEAFNPALDILGQQLKDSGIRDLASVVAFSLSEKPELFERGWFTDSYVSPEFKARLAGERHGGQAAPGGRFVLPDRHPECARSHRCVRATRGDPIDPDRRDAAARCGPEVRGCARPQYCPTVRPGQPPRPSDTMRFAGPIDRTASRRIPASCRRRHRGRLRAHRCQTGWAGCLEPPAGRETNT